MEVTAVLFGAHRAFLPPGSCGRGSVTLRFGTDTVPLSEVVAALGMPEDVPRIVLLDGQPIRDDDMLADGDSVAFVSPIGGG